MLFSSYRAKRYWEKEQEKWRELNSHNETVKLTRFNNENVSVGRSTYGELYVLNHNTDEKLRIGSFCSIAPEAAFILNSDHSTKTLSSYPYKVKVAKTAEFEALSKGDIVIEDDVWIGFRSTILSGVHIGQGAVIAAGSVVTRDVPPYTIVGGTPARVIKKRFSDDVTEFLLTLDYSGLDDEIVRNHLDEIYTEIDGLSLEEVRTLFAWFPKK